MNRLIFREYDIRGVADRDLTDDVAYAIGRTYTSMLGLPKPTIAVARDCRVSGPRLYGALVRGLMEAGANVIDVGVGPTPMLYFSVHHHEADGGIMITGSHNPGDENGFKIMKGKSSFYGKDITELRDRIERGELGEKGNGCVSTESVETIYLDAITKNIDLKGKNITIVLDAGNGSGGPLGFTACKKAGLTVHPLFCDMDGTFPNHHPDPTVPKNLTSLIAKVKETGARAGLAYDGDADRLGAVDENGDIIWGDKLLILFARALLKTRPGSTVIGEVKCSQTLYDDITSHGGNALMWKTGHSLIKAKMKETGALLAGEMSGHLFFADRYFGYDDALYAGLRLAEILANDDRTLSEMLADVPKTFSTPEIRVDCPDQIKFDVVREVTAFYKQSAHPVTEIDGVRVNFGKPGAPAWGLVRASNTGPVLVLRFEAPTEGELASIRKEVEERVSIARKNCGG